MDLDAGAVDEQPIWRVLATRQRGKDALPDTSLGPAHEAVVERLLGAINLLRTVAPASAAFERMDDPGEHSAIINTLHAAHVVWQQRLNPRPLRVRKPKEIRHSSRLLVEA
jgi:hypothetical protein